jgi:hypothetical protein
MILQLQPLVAACAAALFGGALLALVAWKVVRELRRAGVFFVFLGAATLVVMATKPSGSVSFPYSDPEARYLVDRGSYVTNDLVYVDFSRASFVPIDAPLFGCVRPAGATNDAAWVEFLATTFAAFPVPQALPFPGAETNDFVFFTTWTPGPAAHTNGVAVVYWRRRDEKSDIAAPWRTGVYADALRVAPNAAITNGITVTVDFLEAAEK